MPTPDQEALSVLDHRLVGSFGYMSTTLTMLTKAPLEKYP